MEDNELYRVLPVDESISRPLVKALGEITSDWHIMGIGDPIADPDFYYIYMKGKGACISLCVNKGMFAEEAPSFVASAILSQCNLTFDWLVRTNPNGES